METRSSARWRVGAQRCGEWRRSPILATQRTSASVLAHDASPPGPSSTRSTCEPRASENQIPPPASSVRHRACLPPSPIDAQVRACRQVSTNAWYAPPKLSPTIGVEPSGVMTDPFGNMRPRAATSADRDARDTASAFPALRRFPGEVYVLALGGDHCHRHGQRPASRPASSSCILRVALGDVARSLTQSSNYASHNARRGHHERAHRTTAPPRLMVWILRFVIGARICRRGASRDTSAPHRMVAQRPVDTSRIRNHPAPRRPSTTQSRRGCRSSSDASDAISP